MKIHFIRLDSILILTYLGVGCTYYEISTSQINSILSIKKLWASFVIQYEDWVQLVSDGKYADPDLRDILLLEIDLEHTYSIV